jgi:hypothetical protein
MSMKLTMGSKKANAILLIALVFTAFVTGQFFGEYNVFKIRKLIQDSSLYKFSKETKINRYDTKKIPELNLKISKENFDKIKHKRKQALVLGCLIKKKKDDVPAKIKFKDSLIECKIRLKG